MKLPLNSKRKRQFQQNILGWYRINRRDLPWRKTRDPYAILVSEIMLQQTQVSRVINYYRTFIKRFPTLPILARARKATVLKYWSGLGYNSRALRLKELAKKVVAEYQGVIPRNEKALSSFPGIGPYTSRAIMVFAFNAEVPVMDTNIRRVLIHSFKLPGDTPISKLQGLALGLIPSGKSRTWHNALMDYGAMIATAKTTGIAPLTKQSKFLGSNRWVRGSLVKMLLKEKNLKLSVLKKRFNPGQLGNVITKMEKEGMLKRKNARIILS